MEQYIKGECMDMCPEEEMKMRECQKLLHLLEINAETNQNKFPKADRTKMVKEFGRSAAGKKMRNPKNIRPPDVLLKTIHYLLTQVATNETVPWNIIYDFIADRLRAVRQDMVIQNASLPHTITILQPIIRFYAYAGYRLNGLDINIFDEFINNSHLQECLKRLLNVYDDYDQLFTGDKDNFSEFLIKNRPQFEALYIILNIGDSDAIMRGLNLDQQWWTEDVDKALRMSLLYRNGNYVNCCRLIEKFPPLLAAQASLHLPKLRRWSFKVMSVAYNSKVLTYPMDKFRSLLLYNTNEEAILDCYYFGISVVDEKILFQKAYFKDYPPNESEKTVRIKYMKEVPVQKLKSVEEKIEEVPLSSLFLYS